MPALLNPQHEAFAASVAAGVNYTQSAIRARYTRNSAPSTGWEIAQRADIKARIAEIRAQEGQTVEEQSLAEKRWIIVKLIEIVELGIGPSRHAVAKKGKDAESADKYQRDLSSANRALETLARIQGFLRQESYRETLSVNLTQMPERELNALLRTHIGKLSPADRVRIEAAVPHIEELIAEPEVTANVGANGES